MYRFTIADLETLLHQRGGIRISFFLRTHRSGPDGQKGPASLKNLLKSATAELASWIPRAVEAERLLRPVAALVDDAKFWRQQRDGLAIFLSEEGMVYHRLPVAFRDEVVVSNHFHVKPLLPLLAEDGMFYLLALSPKFAGLFRGTRDTLEAVPLAGLPANLEESAALVDGQLQALYRPTAGRAQSLGGAGAFYGHGTAVEPTKADLKHFLAQVNEGVRNAAAEQRWPLVLAGVDSTLALYRDVNTYPHTLDAHLSGNMDEVAEDQLHKRAWAIVGPYFYRRFQAVAAEFSAKAGTGLASADMAVVLRAAAEGRVRALLVATDADHRGLFDPNSGVVTPHDAHVPGDEALLDRCAAETLLHKGAVHAVGAADLPPTADGSPVAAIFRY